MASAVNAASTIVAQQQGFAKEHDLGALFETLTVALIVKKPARAALLPYLAEELARITAARKRGERYVPEGGKGVTHLVDVAPAATIKDQYVGCGPRVVSSGRDHGLVRGLASSCRD